MLNNRSSGNPKKPFANYARAVKIKNKFLIVREKILLCEAFFYGIVNPLQYEFTIPEHRILYSSIKNYLDCFSIDQYSLDSFLQYLTDCGSLQNCGGASFVREIFGGLGEAA